MNVKVKINKFIEARIKAGFSQRHLAREIGASSGYITQLESGERNPSPANANKICSVLDKPFDDIFFIASGCKSERGANFKTKSKAG